MTRPALQSLSTLAAAIARRDLSPVELLADILDRIDTVDPAVRAFVTVDRQGAMRAAREAEREIAASGSRGPLHGVPVAIKDNIPVAGLPTTNGSPLFAGHVTAEDAAVVERLRDAGAIVIGKTALHEWAMGGTCTRQPGGPVRNPWALDRVPGGSSGGSAVAVAAGLATVAIGTDGMGSIRTPAGYCGVVGFKPTHGLVSRYGVLPPTSSGIDHVGVFARGIEDARLVLRAIAGPDPRDPTSRPAPASSPAVPPSGLPRPAGIRVGLVRSPLDDDVLPAVRAAVDETAGILAAAGATLVPVEIPSLALAPLLGPATLSEAQSLLLPLALEHPEGFANPDIRYRLLAAEFVRAADVRRARQLARRLRADVDAALADTDVLLLPTNSTPAFPIDARSVTVGAGTVVPFDRPGGQGRVTTRLTLPFNHAGVPALSLPVPTLVEGLPVGVQLVGRRWGDEALLDVAALLEAAGAAWREPPAIGSPALPGA